MAGNIWKRAIGLVVGGGGYWTLRLYFHVPFDVMAAGLLGILFIAVIGWPIGYFVGRYLAADSDVDGTAFKVVAGLNLVAWAVPVVGMALSTMTLQFSKASEGKRLFYWVLAAIGGWGAMANAGISAAHAAAPSNQAAVAQAIADIRGSQFTTGRSTDRCPYAAREGWSRKDVDTYCSAKALEEFLRTHPDYKFPTN